MRVSWKVNDLGSRSLSKEGIGRLCEIITEVEAVTRSSGLHWSFSICGRVRFFKPENCAAQMVFDALQATSLQRESCKHKFRLLDHEAKCIV